jgi:predicted acyl esterase
MVRGLPLPASPPTHVQLVTEAQPTADKDVDLIWGVKLPMRDGIKLNATVYKPREMQTPLPAIVMLTPYGFFFVHPPAVDLAKHGYVAVIVDCRGRGNSEGQFEPLRDSREINHPNRVSWLQSLAIWEDVLWSCPTHSNCSSLKPPRP